METRITNSQSQSKRIILRLARIIAKEMILSIFMWQISSCTNNLFIVKGYGNHVNQKAEQTTKTKVDSITTSLNTK